MSITGEHHKYMEGAGRYKSYYHTFFNRISLFEISTMKASLEEEKHKTETLREMNLKMEEEIQNSKIREKNFEENEKDLKTEIMEKESQILSKDENIEALEKKCLKLKKKELLQNVPFLYQVS